MNILSVTVVGKVFYKICDSKVKPDMKLQYLKNQKGQATAEMVICLIGFSVVFTGFLQILKLSILDVHTFHEARAESELEAKQAWASVGVDWIYNWDAGADNLKYTRDDVRIDNGSSGSTVYRSELNYYVYRDIDGDGILETFIYDPTDINQNDTDYNFNNVGIQDVAQLARLSKETFEAETPLHVPFGFRSTEMTLDETVYMPVLKIE